MQPQLIGEIIVSMYPDSAVGRRLASQAAIVEAVDGVAEKLGTDEAAKEALRVKRFLGFAEKSTRGRKAADKPAETPAPTAAKPATTPAPAPTRPAEQPKK